jgi:hypothetical protein
MTIKKSNDYIVKLKPALIDGNTAEQAGIEPRDLRWHVYAVAAHSEVKARDVALDRFFEEVPVGGPECINIRDEIKLVPEQNNHQQASDRTWLSNVPPGC